MKSEYEIRLIYLEKIDELRHLCNKSILGIELSCEEEDVCMELSAEQSLLKEILEIEE
jgi:hypothetical protein